MTQAQSMQLSHWLWLLGLERYEADYFDLGYRWDFERDQEQAEHDLYVDSKALFCA